MRDDTLEAMFVVVVVVVVVTDTETVGADLNVEVTSDTVGAMGTKEEEEEGGGGGERVR